jgi:hypothetical protein
MGYAIPGSDIKAGVVAIVASTNFPAGTNPQVLSGASIVMNKVAPGTLSALVTVLPQTNTLTAFAKWQVCDDGTNWYDCVPSNNAANVAIATGTTGTDVATTVNVTASEAVYGHRLARIQLYTGATSSTTGDLGSARYYYRENVGL